MSRPDIYKDGIKTQFSSTNQPDPEKKRVPKLKAQLKRDLAKNYNEISSKIIEKCKNGDIRHIEFLRDWLYGKVPDKNINVNKNSLDEALKNMSNEDLEKYINELENNISKSKESEEDKGS